ncbi:MAG: response regulator [Cyclobacteriaceae bacterium]|nr:response regulator [Cyclobacteriaceae bacterium]
MSKSLVFIVEDNPIHQKMLQVHFEQMLGDYIVRTFSDPFEMYPHLNEKPFAIVLDHFFGNSTLTGLDCLKELKKVSPSTPIIYYTTLSDLKVQTEVMTLGVHQFIIKDSASLARLKTALDLLHVKKKGFFQRLFN